MGHSLKIYMSELSSAFFTIRGLKLESVSWSVSGDVPLPDYWLGATEEHGPVRLVVTVVRRLECNVLIVELEGDFLDRLCAGFVLDGFQVLQSVGGIFG